MDNVLQNQELCLSAFGEFLLKQRLVKEGQARFHVSWVRKFLAQRIFETRRKALWISCVKEKPPRRPASPGYRTRYDRGIG